MRKLFLAATHGVALAVGFALGVYLLPILTEPDSPDSAALQQAASDAIFKTGLTRDLRGSDLLHWGEGSVSISAKQIVHEGKLSPGPDYKLYLVKTYVEHEEEFLPIKDQAQLIGDIKTFSGFVLDVPAGVNVTDYTTVLVWCETFKEFVTSAKYR